VALRERFAARWPSRAFSSSGYVSSIEDNLLPRVERRHFVDDFNNGDGRELESKFLAIHSSAALAVNTFGCFKSESCWLRLAGWTGFAELAFEARCPIGLRGGRPANLDLLARRPARIVAVESKCTEHLETKTRRFSPAYAEQIHDARRDGPWFRAMIAIIEKSASFELLDAAQLIKHAFCLARCFEGQPVTLLYLYWEPADAERQVIFGQHRDEVASFSHLVSGGFPEFRAQSYRELWESWQLLAEPSWLREHVTNLQARYDVSLSR
jgi:hypothetical protein